MKYKAKVELNDYDTRSLIDEIAAAGIPITGVHSGSGQLIIETPVPLSSEELNALKEVVSNHEPIWFEWIEDGNSRREKVISCEEVDSITAHRIRRIIGGTDPIQEQMKVLRLSLYAHEIRLQVLEGKNPGAENIALAETITSQLLALNAQIEAIRAEGKAFKELKGWS